jgi:dihydrofolate reductase
MSGFGGMSMLISIIVAVGPNRVIGAGGRLPWHKPSDLKRFKALTTGHVMVMGRKTFDSIGGKPLINRKNFVISRNPHPPAVPGVSWFLNLESAIHKAEQEGETELFVAGGSQIYAQALPIANRLYLTLVHLDTPVAGDAYFPDWAAETGRWMQRKHETLDDGTTFVIYESREDASRQSSGSSA